MDADKNKKKSRITVDIPDGEINMDDESEYDGYHTEDQEKSLKK